MWDFQDILQRARVLPQLLPLIPPDSSCHLVGGALRDLLLGRRCTDFDFTTPGDPTPLAKSFARTIGGHWFLLDRTRCQSRVLGTVEGEAISYDFAPWRASTLEDDLRLRDFTLNALAWKVDAAFSWENLLDPLNGRGDLNRRLLRACSAQAFADDPLRLLRGVRLCCQLQLTLDPATRDLMAQERAGLERVAAERIRQELAAIFAAGDLSAALAELQDLGLVEELLGLSAEVTPTAAVAAAERMAAALARSCPAPGPLGSAGEETLVDGFSRAGMYQLAALLRSLFPNAAVSAAVQRWRWSRKGLRLLKDLLALPVEITAALERLPGSQRGRALWVAALGTWPQESLCYLWLENGRDEQLGRTLQAAWQAYIQVAAEGRIPDLVGADRIQSLLGLPPGPQVGRALDLVRQAEIQGRVSSPLEAENLLKSKGKKSIDSNEGGPYNRPHVERE